MNHHWRLFIYGALLAAPLGLTACGESHAETQAPAKAAAEAIPVTLTPVVQVPADAPLRVTGRVSHARDFKPAFKTGGVVKEILVDEGAVIKVGDVLARLDTREIDAGIAQVRAALAKANRDYARVDQLVSDAVLPTTTRDDAATAASVAKAQLAGLAFNRETATLVATAPGVVVKRLAEPGEVVGPGMPVLVIGETGDQVRVEVGVPARDLERIQIDGTASIWLDGELAESGEKGKTGRVGKVVEIAPTLTPGTDRVAVSLSIDMAAEGDAARLAGVGNSVRGRIVTAVFAPRTTITMAAVPMTTLVEGSGREATVWVMGEAGKLVARPVTIGRVRPDGLVTIASGLEGVSEVIDAGTAWLDADATVVVKAPLTANAKPEGAP